MKLTLEITSVPDRDELVAEIWHKDEMVGEIQRAHDGRLLLEIYPASNEGGWSFDLEVWMETLSTAKKRLG
jgi:hypothetical protein